MSEALKSYYLALERLKTNQPINVPKGTLINKDSVAMEAGRKRGSIRARKGFERLIFDIQLASEIKNKKTRTKDFSKKYKNIRSEIDFLKDENTMLKTRYLSLLYLNAELARLLTINGIEVPQFGEVIDINISPDP